MKIKSIQLENFGCFKELYLPLPQTSLIYIEGKNEDDSFSQANGCGKSTLLDSIPWVLYNRTLRESGKKKLAQKEIIRKNCNTATAVLDLSDEGSTIRIGRTVTRTSGNLWLELNGETLKGDFAQGFLKKKFDLNFSAFLSSCLFGQGMVNQFLSSTDEEKVSLLEELFKLKDLEDIRQDIKTANTNKGDILLTLSTEVRIAETEYRSQETKYNILKDLHDTSRREAQDSLGRINPANTQLRIETIDSYIKKDSSFLDDLRNKILSLRTTIAGIKASISPTYKAFSVGEECPTCGQVMQNTPPEFKRYKEAIERKNKEIESLTLDVQQTEQNIKKVTDKVATLTTEYYNLLAQKKNEDETVKKAKEVLTLSNDVLEGNLDLLIEKEQRYNKVKDELDRVIFERDHYTRLYKILGEKELRGLIVNQYLDLVNYYAKQYVSYLTNGEVDINFDFVGNRVEAFITHRTHGKFPYLRWSGGERRRIDFGMFLAFNKVNKNIFKTPLDVLLLDEIFDTLDNIGIEKCVSLLKEETKSIGLVLVTGHSEGLESMFDNQILLVKKKGETRVS